VQATGGWKGLVYSACNHAHEHITDNCSIHTKYVPLAVCCDYHVCRLTFLVLGTIFFPIFIYGKFFPEPLKYKNDTRIKNNIGATLFFAHASESSE
jgi:hypothetical protein